MTEQELEQIKKAKIALLSIGDSIKVERIGTKRMISDWYSNYIIQDIKNSVITARLNGLHHYFNDIDTYVKFIIDDIYLDKNLQLIFKNYVNYY